MLVLGNNVPEWLQMLVFTVRTHYVRPEDFSLRFERMLPGCWFMGHYKLQDYGDFELVVRQRD